ncbi:MAG: hypothetical protein JOS17DRAFT_778533 [Linnemannia elongata]|nr:MAG: hypothetical protein JOS17DRAFT_778533 [Linnemannia elongata]
MRMVLKKNCYRDPDTHKEFVLWEDILLAFKDAVHVRHGSRVVPFSKGADFRTYTPHCPTSHVTTTIKDSARRASGGTLTTTTTIKDIGRGSSGNNFEGGGYRWTQLVNICSQRGDKAGSPRYWR